MRQSQVSKFNSKLKQKSDSREGSITSWFSDTNSTRRHTHVTHGWTFLQVPLFEVVQVSTSMSHLPVLTSPGLSPVCVRLTERS